MSKTIMFKSEFETKLKQLKVKTKFVNNLRNAKKLEYTNNSMENIIELLNCFNSFEFFISYAFYWENTPEGCGFWMNISKS